MPKKPTPQSAPRALAPPSYAHKPIHDPFGVPERPAPRVSQGDVAFASAPAFLTGLTALYGAIAPKRGA